MARLGASMFSTSRLLMDILERSRGEIGCHFVRSFYTVSAGFPALGFECRVNQV